MYPFKNKTAIKFIMLTPRSIRMSSSQSNFKNKEIEYIYLYKIDFPEVEGIKVKIPKKNSKNKDSLDPIFEVAFKTLDLLRPPKQLFDENDEPITQFSQIRPDLKVYVSCTTPAVDESQKPLYKSRLPKGYITSQKTLPIVQPPPFTPKPEDSVHHQAIAASPYTVKENLRDSLLTLYSSLTPVHKAHLPCNEALQKLSNETQQYLIEESLISQFIGPTTVLCDQPLGQATTSWAIDRIKGLHPEDYKFVICGPSQSGKTTLLSILVSLFFQKLQLANESDKYLIFPINWLIHQMYIEDIQKLYNLFVTITLNSLKSILMQFIPIINIFQQWFLNLLQQPIFPNLPPGITKFNGFPIPEVTKIGQNIHKAWNSKNGFQQFLKEIFYLPNNLAKCFGFKTAIYVFDHYDSCCLELNIPERFPDSTKSIQINTILN